MHIETSEKSNIIICMVALPQFTVPNKKELLQALREYIPEHAVDLDVSVDKKGGSIKIGEQSAVILPMPVPIPWGDLEGPCATSWIWRGCEEEMKTHREHLIISLLSGPGSQLERCLLLTKIVGASAKVFNAIGVYWGRGSVVLSSGQFQKMARAASIDELPLLAWFEFRPEKNQDGTLNVISTGLEFFGHMEIEVHHSKHSFKEVMNIVMPVANMVLLGEAFSDGDTIGPDNETKIAVRHAESEWANRPSKVMVLVY